MARRTKKVLTDDQKYSRMEAWAKRLGFPKDTAKRMTEKYGMFGYDLMLKALMEPANLKFPGHTSSKNALHYLLSEDKNGNPAPENNVTTADIARLLNKDVATIETGIAEFRTANDIPTPLPTPPEAARQAEQAQARVEARVDAAMPTQPVVEHDAAAEMAPGEAQWIEQELARMKGSRGGELSFSDLRRNGLTNEDMQNALTPEMVQQVHAGPTSRRLAQNAPKIDRNMSGTGSCLSAIQYNTCRPDTTGICYEDVAPPRLQGNRGNAAANCQLAWENSGQFTVFKFQTDHQNTCLYNPPPCAGAIVNYEQGCPATKDGHVAISDGRGTYYCDFAQNAQRFAQGYRNAACTQPYGDFYISFTNDCTVSDDLARQMLHERYLREHPNALTNDNTLTPIMPERTTIPVRPAEADSISNINIDVLRNIRIER